VVMKSYVEDIFVIIFFGIIVGFGWMLTIAINEPVAERPLTKSRLVRDNCDLTGEVHINHQGVIVNVYDCTNYWNNKSLNGGK